MTLPPSNLAISRADARASGLRSYFTGKPCLHGHVALRDVANARCSVCRRQGAVRLRHKHRATENARRREQNKTAPGLLRNTYKNMRARVQGRVTNGSAHCWLRCRLMPRDEFLRWGLNDSVFRKLHAEWAAADYPRRLTPSIDRIDPDGHYEHPNVRFLPHWLNSSRRRDV